MVLAQSSSLELTYAALQQLDAVSLAQIGRERRQYIQTLIAEYQGEAITSPSEAAREAYFALVHTGFLALAEALKAYHASQGREYPLDRCLDAARDQTLN